MAQAACHLHSSPTERQARDGTGGAYLDAWSYSTERWRPATPTVVATGHYLGMPLRGPHPPLVGPGPMLAVAPRAAPLPAIAHWSSAQGHASAPLAASHLSSATVLSAPVEPIARAHRPAQPSPAASQGEERGQQHQQEEEDTPIRSEELDFFLSAGKAARQFRTFSGAARLATGIDLAYQLYDVGIGGIAARKGAEPDAAVQPVLLKGDGAAEQRKRDAPQGLQRTSEVDKARESSDSLREVASGAGTDIVVQQDTVEDPTPPCLCVLLLGEAGVDGDCFLPLVAKVAEIARCGVSTPVGQDAPISAAASVGGGRLRLCLVDHRGAGASSVPTRRRDYSTSIMAADACSLMDHLGWKRAHVVGWGMGGMVALRLAAAQAHRVASLLLLSTSSGGLASLGAGTAMRGLPTAVLRRGVAGRVAGSVRQGYSRRLWHTKVHGRTVGEVLQEEHLHGLRVFGEPPRAGVKGHRHAMWKHNVTVKDVTALRRGRFPMVVVHGKEDTVSLPQHGATLAARLGAPLVMLDDAAHNVVREHAQSVARVLLGFVMPGGDGGDAGGGPHAPLPV